MNAILNAVVRAGLIERWHLTKRPYGVEGIDHVTSTNQGRMFDKITSQAGEISKDYGAKRVFQKLPLGYKWRSGC